MIINLHYAKRNDSFKTQCKATFKITEISQYYKNDFVSVYKIKAVKIPLSSYINPVRVFYYYKDGQSAFGQPVSFDIVRIDD